MVSLKMKATASNKGFTLVELIVVITILAILGTIGFLSLQGYSTDARNTAVKSNISTLFSAMNTTASSQGKTMQSLVTPVPAQKLTTGTAFSGVTLTGGVNYEAGTANFNVITGVDKDKLKDGANDFKVGAAQTAIVSPGTGLTLTKAALQVAGVINEGAEARSYIQGTYNKEASTDVNGLIVSKDGSNEVVIGWAADSLPY
jgi:prepilin-type N-terminal cleavage/methylation domain-containing protein